MRRALGFVLGLTFAAGCGGNSFQSGASGGAGGSSAGSSSAGTSSGKGGGPGSGGSVSTGGTGGIDCRAVDCAYPECPDGQLVTPPDRCCPVCSCDQVACPDIFCADGPPITQPGACCPTCPPPPPPSCDSVMCLDAVLCSSGYTWSRPAGACCAGCVPDPGGVGCDAVMCPDPVCPRGYVVGDLVGACCYDCVPDPLFCEADADCVIADRPRPCCGCPEAISTRMLTEDVCWSSLDEPRVIPPECYPEQICNVICAACPPPGVASCQQNRCSAVF